MLFGDKIKYTRSKKGWTQEELAFHAKLGVKTIQRAEKNVQISLDTLRSIAYALDIDYEYLLDEKKHLTEIKREFSNQAHFIHNSKIFNNNQIIQKIISMAGVRPTDQVLDLACGTGIMTRTIAEKTKKVIAVDITDKMVNLTQKMCNENGLDHVKVFNRNAEKLNFEDNFFDVIITRLSIHHFKNPDIVIKEMKRVLKDDGRIIIADIFSSELLEENQLHNAIEQLRDPTHVKALSQSEFQSLFDTNGLAIKNMNIIETQREYGEWLKITNAPERYEALYIVLKNLIESNKKAGIQLKIVDDKIYFIHSWVIYELNIK